MKSLFVLIFLFSCAESFTLEEGIKFITSDLTFDVSLKCSDQLLQLQSNLKNPGSNFWGAEMVDASSKVQSGIMSLNIGELGNFEQCINTKGKLAHGREVTGKYCLGYLSLDAKEMVRYVKFLDQRVKEQMLIQKKSSIITNLAAIENSSIIQGPTWAGCFPDGCSTEDVNSIVNQVVKKFMETNAKITFTNMYCQTENDVNPKFTPGAIVTLAILWLYFLGLCSCTVYDVGLRYFSKKPYPPIVAFSLYSNTKKLFKITESNDQVSCLNGLRVLSMIWVVMGHQYSITCAGPITNTMDLVKWASSRNSMFLISGTIAVDTFLVVGAVLITMGFLRFKREGRPFPIHMYYLHRYTRLTLPLAAMVLISSTLLVYLGSGPRWPSVKPYFQDNCVNYWWSTLLYIQNYVNVRNMCVGQTWYLSIDMQLFIISPIILTCLHKWPKQALYFICFCVGIPVGVSFYVAMANELTAILSNPFGNLDNYNNKYYLLTHTRAAPWLIGIILGYYLSRHQAGELTIKIGKMYSIIGWSVCILVLSFCVLVGHGSLRAQDYHKLGNALHIALVRPVWSLGICWVIFACVTDRGPISELVNSILGFRYFQVLNRFNYSIYLVHVTMMYLISFARKVPVYFSDFEMLQQFWGSLFLSFALAYIWILAFESPLIVIEKLLKRKERTEVMPEASKLLPENQQEQVFSDETNTTPPINSGQSPPTRSTDFQPGKTQQTAEEIYMSTVSGTIHSSTEEEEAAQFLTPRKPPKDMPVTPTAEKQDEVTSSIDTKL